MAGDTIKFLIEMRDKASAPLKKVGKAAETSGKQAKKAKADYAALAAKVLALGVALKAAKGTVVALTQGLADSRNELADTATRTGITAQTLAGLRLAAEGSGLQLSNLSGSLALFPKRMRDMQAGIGESKRAFEELGISVMNMDGSLRDADTVLKESLTEIMKIPDATTQAAIATELFGRSGTALLQALSGTELQEFVDQAERFGIDIGPAAAQSAADFQRQVATFSMVAEQAASVVADSFGARGAGKVLKGLGAAMITISTLFGGVLRHMREVFGLFVEKFEIRFRFLMDLFGAAKSLLFGDFEEASEKAGKAVDKMGARIAAMAVASEKVFSDLGEGIIGPALQAGAEFLEEDVAGTGKQRQRFTEFRAPDQISTDKTKKTEREKEDAPPTAEELEESMRDALMGTEALLKDASIQLADLQYKLSPAGLAEGLVNKLTDSFGALTTMMGPAGGLVQSLSIMGQEGSVKITKALRDSIKGLIVGLVEVLPKLIVSIPRAIINAVPDLIEGFVLAIPALAEAIIIGLPDAVARGLRRWFRMAIKTIEAIFFPKKEKREERKERRRQVADELLAGDIGFKEAFQRFFNKGKKHTGVSHIDRTGAFLLQAGEAVIPNSGTTTQGMERRMGRRGGMNVTINTNVVDQNSIRSLGKLLEKEFGSMGRSTSPVFNSPTGTTG